MAFPTAHAYALRSASGVDILIHIDMDTVQLKGKHFTPKVVKGQKVPPRRRPRRGRLGRCGGRGVDLTTPVVVSNAKKLAGVEVTGAMGDDSLGVPAGCRPQGGHGLTVGKGST